MTPLARLQSSILFEADFPRRHTDHPDRSGEAIVRARERGVDWVPLVEAVRALSVPGDDSSVPILAELWQTCALASVQAAAGGALLEIGTETALAVMVVHLDHPDRALAGPAVRALFRVDPAAAFDRLAPRFDPQRLAERGGIARAQYVLDVFTPVAFVGTRVPRWADPLAPAWFGADPRWLAVLLALRRHPELGPAARAALRFIDPERVFPALDAATRFEPAPTASAHRVAAGDRVSRYQRGEHEAVWNELRQYEAIDGDLRAEALEVARLTMTRAREAIGWVGERLAARGWPAVYSPADPGQDSAAWQAIAEVGGSLPPSLMAWWEVVGGINLTWDHGRGPAPTLIEGVPLDAMDPLCLPSARQAVVTVAQWCADWKGVHRALWDPLDLALAPDRLAKADVSGGPPHHVVLPFLGADPIFVDGEHDLPFVNYLRLAIRWAGFPELSTLPSTAAIQTFVGEITRGVMTF